MALCALNAAPLSESFHARDTTTTLPPSSSLHCKPKTPLQSVQNSLHSVKYLLDNSVQPSTEHPYAAIATSCAPCPSAHDDKASCDVDYAHSQALATLTTASDRSDRVFNNRIVEEWDHDYYCIHDTTALERHHDLDILHDHRHSQQRAQWKARFLEL